MNERRLATVVRVRELRERIARAEVGRQRQTSAIHEARRAAAWQQVSDRPDPVLSGSAALVSHRAMLRAGVREAIAADHAAVSSERDVAAAVDDWRDEARRLDGIERLAEKLATNARIEHARLAAVELDDLVVSRWHVGTAS